jgi:8-oxo-dGTP diphosphatase
MSLESNIHETQMIIVRYLLFTPYAGFAQLQKATNLTSDHFTFHVRKLMEQGYVEKEGSRYALTPQGKEYADRMDTDENVIEKQPKVTVMITLERQNKNGEREFLFQQRKKSPYYNFWGRVGGKVRWGESIIEAAQRELKEETNLEADMKYQLLYHKRDFDKASGKLLEDKIFLCVYGTNYKGVLKEEFEAGVNKWMTIEEFHKQEKRFTNVDVCIELMEAGERFVEREYYYDKSEY